MGTIVELAAELVVDIVVDIVVAHAVDIGRGDFPGNVVVAVHPIRDRVVVVAVDIRVLDTRYFSLLCFFLFRLCELSSCIRRQVLARVLVVLAGSLLAKRCEPLQLALLIGGELAFDRHATLGI